MNFDRAAAIASRAANAAFRATGGPREFTWLQSLSPTEGGAAALADHIMALPHASPRQLYIFATRGQGAKPWEQVPFALQIAVEVFVSTVRALAPRVERAEREEEVAQTNVIEFARRGGPILGRSCDV